MDRNQEFLEKFTALQEQFSKVDTSPANIIAVMGELIGNTERLLKQYPNLDQEAFALAEGFVALQRTMLASLKEAYTLVKRRTKEVEARVRLDREFLSTLTSSQKKLKQLVKREFLDMEAELLSDQKTAMELLTYMDDEQAGKRFDDLLSRMQQQVSLSPAEYSKQLFAEIDMYRENSSHEAEVLELQRQTYAQYIGCVTTFVNTLKEHGVAENEIESQKNYYHVLAQKFSQALHDAYSQSLNNFQEVATS